MSLIVALKFTRKRHLHHGRHIATLIDDAYRYCTWMTIGVVTRDQESRVVGSSSTTHETAGMCRSGSVMSIHPYHF